MTDQPVPLKPFVISLGMLLTTSYTVTQKHFIYSVGCILSRFPLCPFFFFFFFFFGGGGGGGGVWSECLLVKKKFSVALLGQPL